jgi:hypothetical protein
MRVGIMPQRAPNLRDARVVLNTLLSPESKSALLEAVFNYLTASPALKISRASNSVRLK